MRMSRFPELVVAIATLAMVVVMFAAPGVATQQREVEDLPDGMEISTAYRDAKMDSRLVELQDINAREGIAAVREYATANDLLLDEDDRVRVTVRQDAEATYSRTSSEAAAAEEALFAALEPRLRAQIEAAGGEVHGRVKNLIEADLPLGGLSRLRDSAAARWIAPAPRPHALDVKSEGLGLIAADSLQASTASYRPSGRKVRIGVLDTGFFLHAPLLGTELPSSVTTRSFHSGGLTAANRSLTTRLHGTAVAEIIHDVAPDAELFFTNADSLLGHRNAVTWLLSHNVDLISNSVAWFNVGPGDGRGPINDDVRRALNNGAQWVVAAGNQARRYWEGTFSDPDADGFHNYAGADETNGVFLNAGELLIVRLSWDDWFSSNQDYDLGIFDEDLDLLAFSVNPQTGTQPPSEVTGIIAPRSGTYHVVIARFNATRNVRFRMFLQTPRPLQFRTAAGSLTIPADTDGAVAVGAVDWRSDQREPFSSQGPTVDGRVKPDISAPDRVTTVSFGRLGFPGTSSATPHVTGAIALMKSRFGIYSFDQIVEILQGRAIEKGPAGKDNLYGSGRLDLRGR